MPTSEQDSAELAALKREVAQLREVDDRLRAENEHLIEVQRVFEEIRDQYAELYDSAPIAWLTLEPHGSIQNLNRLAQKLFGVDQQRLLGAPLATLVVLEDRRRLLDHLLACRNTLDPVSCEVRLLTREGTSFPVRLVTRRERRRGEGYTCAVVDLRELEAAAKERERLATSEREARAANVAKDQFIAMLSHELRTPLTPVLAAASAFSESIELPADVRAAFSIVQRNVLTEAQLIDDLLDVARITNGKMHIDKHPVDAHRAVREAFENLTADAAQKDLTIELELDASRSWVNGDSTRLQQVVSNLLRNAIKFTPQGGRVEVRTWNHQRRLLLEVSDTGRGIEQDKLSRLFEPFEQILDVGPGSLRGLGLGLAICRGIVREHDGSIVATSQGPGKGARFVVEINTVNEPPPAEVRQSSVPPPPSSRARILLVEDHEDTAEILSMLLARGGYQVKVANSVGEALAVDRGAFDVLLSDVGLGDGSGLELMRTLRKTGKVKGIALSGYGTEEDVRASRDAGFAAHVTKPVNFGDLIEAIATLHPY